MNGSFSLLTLHIASTKMRIAKLGWKSAFSAAESDGGVPALPALRRLSRKIAGLQSAGLKAVSQTSNINKRRGLSLSQVQTQGRDCVSRCPRPTWTWFSPSLLSAVFRHRPGLSPWLERMLRPALLTPWELVLWKFPASCQGNSALIVLGNSKEVFFLREGKKKQNKT